MTDISAIGPKHLTHHGGNTTHEKEPQEALGVPPTIGRPGVRGKLGHDTLQLASVIMNKSFAWTLTASTVYM